MPDEPGETFAKGMARNYRGIKDAYNHTRATSSTPEIRDRVNSDLDRVIEYWEKQDKPVSVLLLALESASGNWQ